MEKIYKELTVAELFSAPEHSIAYPLLSRYTYPWEALDGISDFIRELGKTLSPDEYEFRDGDVYISKAASVAPTAYIVWQNIVNSYQLWLKERQPKQN